MGLKTPSKENDIESSEMGLKMPSRVVAKFIRGLLVGIPIPVVCRRFRWGSLVSVEIWELSGLQRSIPLKLQNSSTL